MEISELTQSQRNALDDISDKIRSGVPVGALEAMLAIEYQYKLKEYRKQQSIWFRLKQFLKSFRQT